MLSPQLKRKIHTLWDAFWSGGVANPLTAIEQITYLVFIKRLEDLDIEREKSARATGQPYKSMFDFSADEKKNLLDGSQYRWSYIKRLEPSDRFDHMRKYVFDWLKSIEGDDQDRMRDAVFLIPNANLLTRAVLVLDDLFVPDRNQDTLGDIYEDLLNEIATAGKNGQFRTPRHIIRAMCDLVDVKYGDHVCDPACGTGGFLVNAYQHILQSSTSPDILRFKDDGTPINAIGDQLTAGEHKELRHNHLHGFDFDRTMVRLGWMNMIQHGLENPKINYADSLGSKFNERVAEGGDLHETFDVVLANPPFTGNIDKYDIGETLRHLGANKTELLFVDLILQLLKPGGRAAVIVPEGVVYNSTRAHLNLRRKLIEQTQIQAVISLPPGVFQPYAGVKTSILVFLKGGQTEKVWFYEVTADGETLNAKRDPDPERNDLWDKRMKFKLRYGQEPPAFIRQHEEEWHDCQVLSEGERSRRYLQPVFTQAEETDEEGSTFYLRILADFETVFLDHDTDWLATREEIEEDKISLEAPNYKPRRETTKEYDPPEKIIEDLYTIEENIQAGLDRLSTLLNNAE